MKHFYLAAPYAARDQALALAILLRVHGYTCTSSWLRSTRPIGPGTVGPTMALTATEVTAHATADLEDIRDAEALVLMTGQFVADSDPGLMWATLHTGGRHVEVGYALANGLPVIVLGEPENVFQRGLCQSVSTPMEVLGALDDLARVALATSQA